MGYGVVRVFVWIRGSCCGWLKFNLGSDSCDLWKIVFGWGWELR